jgi:DNA-binding beta-propeller fold protein YncE
MKAFLLPVVAASVSWVGHTQTHYTPYTFVTLAGNGDPGGADGPAASAQFNGPHGVAVDASGVVYVADTGNHTIRKITPDGMVSTLAEHPGGQVRRTRERGRSRQRGAVLLSVGRGRGPGGDALCGGQRE